MNIFIKYATASALILAVTACATTDMDKTMTKAEPIVEKMDTSASLGDKMAEAAPMMETSEADMVETDTSESDTSETGMMDDAPKAEEEADTKMESVTVGGAEMLSSKTIVENASQAENLTTLVSAVKQAELVETLSGDGPFTVFAPTNAAFSYLPEGVAANLMKDENKEQLVKVLTAHVVPGELKSDFLMAVVSGGSTYDVTTVSGDTLTFYKLGETLRVGDENGTLAKIETADVMQSNGVVHVVNAVLVPK